MKKRFKMYKAGKLWLVAAGLFVSEVAIANSAKADTTDGQPKADNEQTTNSTDVQATNSAIQQQQVNLNYSQPVADAGNQAVSQTNPGNEEINPRFKQASDSQARINAGKGLNSADQTKIDSAINNKEIVFNSQNINNDLDKDLAINHSETEQNRTEQNRTEQNRTEQNR